MKLTKPQQAAIDKLRSVNLQTLPRTAYGSIKTGINSNTLFNLHSLGLIKCETVYAGGIVTKDLVVL